MRIKESFVLVLTFVALIFQIEHAKALTFVTPSASELDFGEAEVAWSPEWSTADDVTKFQLDTNPLILTWTLEPGEFVSSVVACCGNIIGDWGYSARWPNKPTQPSQIELGMTFRPQELGLRMGELVLTLNFFNGTSFEEQTFYTYVTGTGVCTAEYCSRSGLPPVPIPAALPLLVSGLSALAVLGWARNRKDTAVAVQ